MVGSPPGNYWVDDGKVTENPPSRLLDQRGRWIPSPGGPVANTMAFLRPACEANREGRDNGFDPAISLEIAAASHRGHIFAPVPEFGTTRQRDRISQPSQLRTLLPRPRPVANAPDVRATSRFHQPPPAESQLPPPSRLHSGTQRENTAGLRHPMLLAPLSDYDHHYAPQVRHMTAVPHSLSVRGTGPRVCSMTTVRHPTPTLAPLVAFRRDHPAQIHHRRAVSNTTRFEYPSPPPQSSYYTAGIDPATHRHGQVRTFPGPYYISREQAYRISQGGSPNRPVLSLERENTLAYSDSAHFSLDVSCAQCGSHGHSTTECPYLPEPQ